MNSVTQKRQVVIMTAKEYAEKYRFSYSSIRRLLMQNKIPSAKRIGGRWRISEIEEVPAK